MKLPFFGLGQEDNSSSTGRFVLKRRRMLVLGALVMLLPLLVMLRFQYVRLADLHDSSAAVRRAKMENLLDVINKKTEYFYKDVANTFLNVPPSLMGKGGEELETFFQKRREIKSTLPHKQGKDALMPAELIFVLPLSQGQGGDLYFFDPVDNELADDVTEDVVSAVFDVSLYWQYLAEKLASFEIGGFFVETFGDDRRMILKPILDPSAKLVGLAGMIVDDAYFTEAVLPVSTRKILSFASERDQVFMKVFDQAGDVRYFGKFGCKEASAQVPTEEVSVSGEFLYENWSFALYVRPYGLGSWARTNFVYNMTVSVVLALLLLAGVTLVLRTAGREMALSDMKNEFVSNVSHELRTPIASIRVFGELLRGGRVRDPAKVSEYGEFIETESRRLGRLVENILDFSKIESGNKNYEFQRMDIREVLDTVIHAFKVRLDHEHVDFKVEGLERDIPELNLDPDAMSQAFFNLLDNAVKYGGQDKSVTVTLGVDHQEVFVAVSDAGIGISKEEQKRVFDRFHRVRSNLVHDTKGCGLGLAIVKHVVAAHSGRLSLQSELGKGSRFTIHVPIPMGTT